MSKFLTEQHLSTDAIYQQDLSKLGIRATPTVFVIDQKGIVRQVFVGQLQGTSEANLLIIARNRHL